MKKFSLFASAIVSVCALIAHANPIIENGVPTSNASGTQSDAIQAREGNGIASTIENTSHTPLSGRFPFKTGDVLKWSTHKKRGTLKVADVSSLGKFTFHRYDTDAPQNDGVLDKLLNNKYTSKSTDRDKNIKLTGEILGEGTYKIENPTSHEIWIGRRDGNEISGKINNETPFNIRGLK